MSDSVKEYLGKGDFLFANPSSIHTSGKKSKRFINRTREFLYQLFGLDEKEWSLFFHSGATEAINNIFKGFAFAHLNNHNKCQALVASSDHSAVWAQIEDFQHMSQAAHSFSVDEHGDFKSEELESTLRQISTPTLMNFTWVNNETGVVWDLEKIEKLKAACPRDDLFIHVDAVQSVGKIEDWQHLSTHADIYTYSAHKFGALKGVGFSFVKKSFPLYPLIRGGGQQLGLRSGTENTDGIYSIKLALDELIARENLSELAAAKSKIEADILNAVNVVEDQARVAGAAAQRRNANTISLVFKNTPADILLTAFDLAGMDVSSGSACSSGTISPSRVLLAMGYSEQEAKSALRLSLSPLTTAQESENISERIVRVLSRFNNKS